MIERLTRDLDVIDVFGAMIAIADLILLACLVRLILQ